jgi:hypothetical protein
MSTSSEGVMFEMNFDVYPQCGELHGTFPASALVESIFEG